MNNERIKVIKQYINDNIKILGDLEKDLGDKEVSRMLIKEEVESLIKDYLYTIIMGTTEQVLAFRIELKEVAEKLQDYLREIEEKTNQHDEEIYRVYSDMLLII